MKPEQIYERRKSCGEMEAIMLFASFIGGFTAIIVFLAYGWVAGLTLLLLSLIAFALSRVFNFFSDLFYALGQEKHTRPDKDKSQA